MSGEISSLVLEGQAIFLTGICIKVMDDYLDIEIDALLNKKTLAAKLGPGVLPYLLLLFSIALTAGKDLTLALFLASYAVGMYQDLSRPLPSGLKGWQESLIVAILGFFIVGWQTFAWSLAVISAVQLMDDLLDYRQDQKAGVTKAVQSLGFGETAILALILVSFSFALAIEQTLMVLGLAPVVKWLVAWAGQEG